MSLGFRFELGWTRAKLVYSSNIDKDLKVSQNYISWNVDSRDICWSFPPLRRPSAAKCRVAGPLVVAGLRGTWKPTRRWLGFEHSKHDHGKGEMTYEGIMKRKELMPGLLYRIGSRSDSMPESVHTPDDHDFGLFCFFAKLTREEQTSNSFGENIYFNCWNAVGAMIFHRSQE